MNGTNPDSAQDLMLGPGVLESLIEGCQVIGFDWTYVYLNEAAAMQARRPKHELLGRTMMDCYPGIEGTAMFSMLRRCMAERTHGQLENLFEFPGGSRLWFALRFAPVPQGMCIFSLDVTERRLLVRAKDAAETANRELESFSYSVAHDLRAPLRHIDGFSQALLEECADRLNEQGMKYLGRIRQAALRMSRLIDDLLGLSRLSRTDLNRQTVDLSAFARTALARLGEHDPARHVESVIEDGLTADADPRLLAIVFDNLLGNAWKFTSKRAAARIEFGAVTQDDAVEYFVRDNGAGFDPAYAGKLFGVFQRLHAANEFEGTGIGLATVQRIIHRHEGRIRAEGRLDAGATFYFTLGRASRSSIEPAAGLPVK